jgi:hypothetical protein
MVQWAVALWTSFETFRVQTSYGSLPVFGVFLGILQLFQAIIQKALQLGVGHFIPRLII